MAHLSPEQLDSILTDGSRDKLEALIAEDLALKPQVDSLVQGKDQEEMERKIIGLYMVSETFAGNHSEDGLIPAHADFKMKFTGQEAEKMLFWNYYKNKNYPDRLTWNSGKFRYFDNVWAMQILRDIISLKTDEDEIKYATNFLEYFAEMNFLDLHSIPEASGALKQ